MIDLQRENARLQRENQALLKILHSLLDESRWSDLDDLVEHLCQQQPITGTVQ
jgi:hypothetical protein